MTISDKVEAIFSIIKGCGSGKASVGPEIAEISSMRDASRVRFIRVRVFFTPFPPITEREKEKETDCSIDRDNKTRWCKLLGTPTRENMDADLVDGEKNIDIDFILSFEIAL
jgi:hypothetical protein